MVFLSESGREWNADGAERENERRAKVVSLNRVLMYATDRKET